MSRRSFIFLILLSFLTFSSYAETIKLKSGKTIEVRIIEKNDNSIKVDIGGMPITYYLNEIESIDGKNILEEYSTPKAYTSKKPQDIFESISPAIVSIIAKTSNGEQVVGTGFIIDSQGIVATSYHIAPLGAELSVKLKDGSVYPHEEGVMTVASVEKDICIFKVNAQNLPTVNLGSAQTSEVGESVYCIGNPLGYEYSFSDGILSGVRNVSGKLYPNIKFLQFTAPSSPGNSGSPLLNSQGQVIGVVSSGVQMGQNLNFAVAIDEAYGEIGCLYLWIKQYQQAISYFQKVIQLNPTNAPWYDYLATAYRNLGQYQKAREYLQKAKELFEAQKGYQNVQRIEGELKELP